jgi:NADPH:quinone reductase-like Zn-dependent oxidoreductase
MPLAIQIDRHGGPEEMHLRELPVGDPGPGQIRIRHKASGLNFIDVYQRSGLYPFAMPLSLGMEGAGVVEAVGAGVTHLGPVNAMQGVAKLATARPSRRATPHVPLHMQGAQRRGVGCGELPFGLPRQGAVCGVARACKASALAARGRLASSPLAGQRDPLHSANRPYGAGFGIGLCADFMIAAPP